MTTSDKEMEDHARDCVRLALLAKSSPELREQLLQMTREWMAAAMHESKMPEPKPALVH